MGLPGAAGNILFQERENAHISCLFILALENRRPPDAKDLYEFRRIVFSQINSEKINYFNTIFNTALKCIEISQKNLEHSLPERFSSEIRDKLSQNNVQGLRSFADIKKRDVFTNGVFSPGSQVASTIAVATLLGNPITLVPILFAVVANLSFQGIRFVFREAKSEYYNRKYIKAWKENLNPIDDIHKLNCGDILKENVKNELIENLNRFYVQKMLSECKNFNSVMQAITYYINRKQLLKVCDASYELIILGENLDYIILSKILYKLIIPEKTEAVEIRKKKISPIFRKIITYKNVNDYIWYYFREKLLIENLKKESYDLVYFYGFFKSCIFPCFFENKTKVGNDIMYGVNENSLSDIINEILEFIVYGNGRNRSNAVISRNSHKENNSSLEKEITNPKKIKLNSAQIIVYQKIIEKAELITFKTRENTPELKNKNTSNYCLTYLCNLSSFYEKIMEMNEYFFSIGSKLKKYSNEPENSSKKQGQKTKSLYHGESFTHEILELFGEECYSQLIEKSDVDIPKKIQSVEFIKDIGLDAAGGIMASIFSVLVSETLNNLSSKQELKKLSKFKEKMQLDPENCDRYSILKCLSNLLKNDNIFEMTVKKISELQVHHAQLQKYLKRVNNSGQVIGSIEEAEEAYSLILKFSRDSQRLFAYLPFLSQFVGIISSIVTKTENDHAILDKNLYENIHFMFNEVPIS